MLLGDYSWVRSAVQVSENLFWVNKFTGMQFTVIFRKFYKPILDANFGDDVITDINLSKFSDNKFVIYPYISVQENLGILMLQSQMKEKDISEIFECSMKLFDILDEVRKYYLK